MALCIKKMRVTGFTFIKNALIYDYPIVEAIRSVLPLCDDFVVAVGDSTDDTLALIEGIGSDKIRIVRTVWDDSLREGGAVLAAETNKALEAVGGRTDWAIYIQGDEVVHERYHEAIRAGMEQYCADDGVDGLLFDYLHFYGSYDYVATSPRWYTHEIRVVRPHVGIYSYRDAQGFRKGNGEKLNVAYIKAAVYHYGWVKDPVAMQRKQETFHRLWHDEDWIARNVVAADAFDYAEHIDELQRFEGTHPEVMLNRIAHKAWTFDYDISFNKKTWKTRIKALLKRYLKLDFSYRNYRIRR